MDNKEIIDNLIEYENINTNFKNGLYNNVYDKYLNGECESLVHYLYLLNNSNGTMIELYGISYTDGDYDENVYHYIYKSEDNKYFDINGEFDNIYDLIEELCLFDELISNNEKTINTYNLENSKNFLNFKEFLDIKMNELSFN